jgi:hypothetical protein
MSMLLFMPWCPIDKVYEVGEITILPFTRHKAINGLDEAAQCKINAIMATYRGIDGKPIQKASLIRYRGKSPIEELTDDEIEIVQDFAVIACFAGLANREYFNNIGRYCNSDCFSLYIQKFEKADSTTLTVRRREGRTLSNWALDNITITIPIHCHTIQKVSLDSALLKALWDHRAQLNNDDWGRWQNAISCFNQANTDSDNIRHQVEWVLLCSAFEHILGAKSEAKDVAGKFAEALVPSRELLAKDAVRLSGQQKNGGKSLRYEWMREFYRIRGDFAHGKMVSQQPATWNPLEHLVLATLAFPLLVKSLLSKASKYKLTDYDQAQLDSFEEFADTSDCLKPPSNRKGSLDSHWKRLLDARRWNIASQRALNQAKESLTPDQQGDLEKKPEKDAH